jgi:nicotinamidase-related amidase
MDHIKGLRFGRVGPNALHLCVDMQRLFAEDSPWASPAVTLALPGAREIARRKPENTIFSRFLCPTEPLALQGQWLRFYADCPEMLHLDPRLFEVIPELASIGAGARTVSRHVFSVFRSEELQFQLLSRKVETLIFTGVETDVCVLATVFSAVDAGLRVIVVEGAVASSDQAGHEAALRAIMPRFDQQIEVVDPDQLLAAWL